MAYAYMYMYVHYHISRLFIVKMFRFAQSNVQK